MEIDLTDKLLTVIERKEIEALLARESTEILDDLEQMWYLLDLVWYDYKCDNKALDWIRIGEYYSHPVWILNGLFAEHDKESIIHRQIISNWVVENTFKRVVDYGGGLGTLARFIAEKDKSVEVDIYEPHPSNYGLERAKEYNNIKIIDKLDLKYQCLMSTDVLEHVPEPLSSLADMVRSTEIDGYLIIANAFFPMIECHLPQNFHFRYSFDFFAKLMGLEVMQKLGGTHATIYKKVQDNDLNWKKIRFYEKLSKLWFPFRQSLSKFYGMLKKE